MKRIILAVVLAVSLQAVAQLSSARSASSNPKVRAITGFVRLDRTAYQKQIGDALRALYCGAGLELPISTATFHEPSFCFFQIDMYLP